MEEADSAPWAGKRTREDVQGRGSQHLPVHQVTGRVVDVRDYVHVPAEVGTRPNRDHEAEADSYKGMGEEEPGELGVAGNKTFPLRKDPTRAQATRYLHSVYIRIVTAVFQSPMKRARTLGLKRAGVLAVAQEAVVHKTEGEMTVLDTGNTEYYGMYRMLALRCARYADMHRMTAAEAEALSMSEAVTKTEDRSRYHESHIVVQCGRCEEDYKNVEAAALSMFGAAMRTDT